MSRYKNFVCLIIFFESIILLVCNGAYLYQQKTNYGRMYRVEARRVAKELQENSPEEIDLEKYDTIVAVGEFFPNDVSDNDYVVEEAGGRLYRIEYRSGKDYRMLLFMNLAMILMIALTAAVLIYVQRKVLRPFSDMRDLPYELARGNLSVPIKEEKSKLFGRFLWGMDMLREKLEEDRGKELQFQRDKMTWILSLSHDIRTPLSAIELYAKALSSGLYESQDKKEGALLGITRNVGEIKRYVDEIVAASREDFINLEVIPGETYLSELIHAIERYYREKLNVIHTDLEVEGFADCLVKGDRDRLIEILQNVMENAIKYGDGRKIMIYGEDEEDCKLIHIENTGCSLKEEELQNIFDSFYRGSNSRTVEGNGLGLYICRMLMKKMDGDVFAQIRGGQFRVTVVVRKA